MCHITVPVLENAEPVVAVAPFPLVSVVCAVVCGGVVSSVCVSIRVLLDGNPLPVLVSADTVQ